MILKIIATIILIWVAIAILGSVFGILGKLIWLGVLLTIASMAWGYIKRNE